MKLYMDIYDIQKYNKGHRYDNHTKKDLKDERYNKEYNMNCDEVTKEK